jgi:subtilisin-like proprotein convertase family protein
VAGLIAALGWNGIGSRGVAPAAKFAAFKFIMSYPASTTAESYLAREVDQFYGNFDVFNYSWGMDGRQFFGAEDTINDALLLGVTTLRNGKGALYVQSAGNSFHETYDIGPTTIDVAGNANSQADTATPFKIIVGATNASGVKSSYSSPGSNIWVSAPGGEFGDDEPAMVTTDIQGCNAGMSYRRIVLGTHFNWGAHASNSVCDYTNIMNGTSSAAPVTTGVIALMLEARPELTWRDVKHILASTSDQIDFDLSTNTLSHPTGLDLITHVYDYKWIVNGAGKLFSNWYGFGRVNAKAAVAMARTYNLSTLGIFDQTIHSGGTWFYSSGALSGEVILDTSPAALENRIWVGHNYVIENVQIEVSVDHDFPGDLAILLESPDGTESRLLNINSRIYSADGLDQHIFSSNAFYGEESEGWWTIKIIDGDPTYAAGGELTNWKININGHRKSTDLLTPYPPTFITLAATPATSDRTPVFGFTQSVSHASLLTYQAMVEKASDGTVVKNWSSIGLANGSQQFTGLTLIPGEVYNLKIRAVSSGGASSVQLKQWTSN